MGIRSAAQRYALDDQIHIPQSMGKYVKPHQIFGAVKAVGICARAKREWKF